MEIPASANFPIFVEIVHEVGARALPDANAKWLRPIFDVIRDANDAYGV
jgi:hypothetical protein